MAWDPHGDNWLRGLRHAQDYYRMHHHLLVRQKYVREDGFRLGSWVNEQRTAYSRNRLPPDRVARLEALPGWTWDATRQAD